jgi:DNA-binding SARP family transcriptional activator
VVVEPADHRWTWTVLICLLGRFRLVTSEHHEPIRVGGKTQTLLSMLALAPRGVAREDLLGAVWPDSDRPLAAQSLNSLVHHLQRALNEPLGGEHLLLRDSGCYRLNHDAGVAVDALRFAALVANGDRQAAAGDADAALVSYCDAEHLYGGDLEEVASVDAVVERERLRAMYLTVLGRLADHHFAAGDYATSQQYARRSLAWEPCREDAHRVLMRCYVRQGERAQALRQYRICEGLLRVEFEAAPEAATRRLFDQVRDDPGVI